MIKAKFAVFATALVAASSVQAGGILTNTNQNISFNRNFARDGVIAIDGVYSNPAGVAFLGKGFHLSLNIQNVYQTRTIVSGMNVPAFKGTPYRQRSTTTIGDFSWGLPLMAVVVKPLSTTGSALSNVSSRWCRFFLPRKASPLNTLPTVCNHI